MNSIKRIQVDVSLGANGKPCYRFPGAPHSIKRFHGHVHFDLVLGEGAAGCRFASGGKPIVTLHGNGYPASMLHRDDFQTREDCQSQSMRWRNPKGQTKTHEYRVELDIRDATGTDVPPDHVHSAGGVKAFGHDPVIRNEPES